MKLHSLTVLINLTIGLMDIPHETARVVKLTNNHFNQPQSDESYQNIQKPIVEHRNIKSVRELSGLVEGDIQPPVMLRQRNGAQEIQYRWPNSTIPYIINNEEFEEKEVATINKVIAEFNSRTCLLLRPYEKGDKNVIQFHGNLKRCWSKVGMQGGMQIISLQSKTKCTRHGTIIHEIMHAIGFIHQQSAADRDKYITVVWDNIKDKSKKQFKSRMPTMDFGLGYDYHSVMHYSQKAFSKNGELTLLPVQPIIKKLGQRKDFSVKDIEKINRMYSPIFCHPFAKPIEETTPNPEEAPEVDPTHEPESEIEPEIEPENEPEIEPEFEPEFVPELEPQNSN